MNAPTATRLQLALGFAAIYILWGSTYLAIRWGVATIPPFVMGAVRFLFAGVALYAWCRVRGAAKPSALEWRNAAIIGALLLFIGNGAVSWSEQRVSSGMTSLVLASVPLWMVLGERVLGKKPTVLQLVGVAVGLVGVGLLVLPANGAKGAAIDPIGAIVLTLGALSWTAGSLYSRQAVMAKPAALAIAMQMLAAGALFLILAALTGQLQATEVSAVSTRSALSVVYLIVFGSLVGFSAYMWLLQVASPTAVGTYAYVNPVVAVLLGVMLGGEELPPQAILAMIVIVGGVAMVSLAPRFRSGTK